jgi:NhaP-type Na+/H+ or K+/H+ antiporter
MFARLTAKAVLATAAIAMAFFGICLLGAALAVALTHALGTVGGYAVAGAIFLLPPLLWAIITHLSRPRRPPPQTGATNDLTRVLLAAVAKETPWVAIVGAGLAGVANMFLNRNKSPK